MPKSGGAMAHGTPMAPLAPPGMTFFWLSYSRFDGKTWYLLISCIKSTFQRYWNNLEMDRLKVLKPLKPFLTKSKHIKCKSSKKSYIYVKDSSQLMIPGFFSFTIRIDFSIPEKRDRFVREFPTAHQSGFVPKSKIQITGRCPVPQNTVNQFSRTVQIIPTV